MCVLCLRPATPGWGARWVCVCLGSSFGCAQPLLAGLCVVGVCARARVLAVPRLSWVGFVVCGLVVAWHLFVCRGSVRVVRGLRVSGTRRPSLLGTCLCALVVAGGVPLWRASWPRVVCRASSGRVALVALVGFPVAVVPFPTPGAWPPALLGGCAGHAEAGQEPDSLCLPLAPAEAGALGSLRVVPVRAPAMGLSLAGPSSVVLRLRALRWLACVDPVTDASGSWTVRRSTGDLAGAPGLFCVDADTSLLGSEDATPGSRACVRVLALLGQVGRAGLPRAFWCASPFPLAALAFCFAWPPPCWGCPCLGLFFFRLLSPARPLCLLLSLVSGPGCPGSWRYVLFSLLASRFSFLGALSLVLCCPPGCWLLPGGCLPPPLLCLAVFRAAAPLLGFFSPLSAPPLSLAFSGFRPRVPWALALCFAFFFPPASRLSVRSRFFFSCSAFGCSLVLGAPPPPLLLCLAGFVAAARCPPPSFPVCAPVVLAFSGFRPRVRWALALCFVCFVGLPLLGSPCALSFFFGSPHCWLLPGGCCPPPPLPLGAPFFFIFALCAPVVSGFLRFPAPGALGPGAARCLLCWPTASRLSVCASFVPPVWLLAAPWWVLPPPAPFCVSRFSSLPLGAVCRVLCCAVCPGLRCCAALLRVVSPGVVLLCAVLFCCARLVSLLVVPCPLVLPVALGICALRRCVLRCSPTLCVFCCCVVVSAVLRRSVLCYVCPGVLCCAFPVLSTLCGAVLRRAGALALCCSCGVCCCWRLVLWCAAVCCAVFSGVLWCGAGSGGPWLFAGAVLWRLAVRFHLLVVVVCVFSLCVRCCVALRVVLFGSG